MLPSSSRDQDSSSRSSADVSERLETYRARYIGSHLKAFLETLATPAQEAHRTLPTGEDAGPKPVTPPGPPGDAGEPGDNMGGAAPTTPERATVPAPRTPAPRSVPPVLRRYVGAALLAGCALLLSVFTFEYQYVGDLSGFAGAGRDPDVFGGIVRPSSDSTIAATAPVRIEQVLVEPGQRVREGDTLFLVDDREARQALPGARLEVEDAALEVQTLELQLGALDQQLQDLSLRFLNVTGELEVAARHTATIPTPQVRSSTERAQAAFDLATMKLQRARQLHTQGIIARQEVDDAEIALRVAQDDLELSQRADKAFAEAADVEASRARLRAELASAQAQRERRQRSAARARARIRHERAIATAAAFEERVATSRIQAAAPGAIAEVRVSRGDVVPAGAVLARIADVARLVAEVQVPSGQLPRLRIGDPATVAISAASAVRARGVIRSIEPTPGPNGTHRVVIGFQAPEDLILAGQAANISFPGNSDTSVRSRF
jgi:HlyD family secretion protein